jgi:hypothetical protein
MNIHDGLLSLRGLGLASPKRHHGRLDLFTRERPRSPVKSGDHGALEVLMQDNRFVIIGQVIGEQGQGKLRWAAAAVTPLESGGTVVPQVEPGIEGPAVDGDAYGIAFASALVGFHANSFLVA